MKCRASLGRYLCQAGTRSHRRVLRRWQTFCPVKKSSFTPIFLPSRLSFVSAVPPCYPLPVSIRYTSVLFRGFLGFSGEKIFNGPVLTRSRSKFMLIGIGFVVRLPTRCDPRECFPRILPNDSARH
jgi:hypothetical protein